MFAAPGIFIAKADHVSIYSPKKEQGSQPGVVGMHKEQANIAAVMATIFTIFILKG
jgi:hypothetical protein